MAVRDRDKVENVKAATVTKSLPNGKHIRQRSKETLDIEGAFPLSTFLHSGKVEGNLKL